MTDSEGQATYPTAPGTSLSLPDIPFCWAGQDDHSAQGFRMAQLEQEALVQESREQTLLALHRLEEGFINLPQEGKGGFWVTRVGLLACGVPQT